MSACERPASHPDYTPVSQNVEIIAEGMEMVNFILSPLSADDPGVPALQTALLGNHPNPFGTSTSILYSLKESGPVRVAIYNLKGELVRNLVNESQNPGQYSAVWNGLDGQNRPVANGVYYCVLRAGGFREVNKLLLLK